MSQGKQLFVVVLGMHRSGTSAFTEILVESGFYVGEPHDLMPPDEGNPRGYFERFSVAHANDMILGLANGDWANPPKEAELLRVRADPRIEALLRVYRERDRVVVKDPRMCLTLPAWRHILDRRDELDIRFVAIVRAQESVARSLHKRDRMPLDHARAVWQIYNDRALHYSAGYPVFRLSYEELFADDRPEMLRQFAKFLDIPDDLESVAKRVIQADLRHHGREPAPTAPTPGGMLSRQREHADAPALRLPQAASEATACHLAAPAPPADDAYHVVLIQPPGNVHVLAFAEIAKLLCFSFESLGKQVEFHLNELAPRGMNIVLGYHLIDEATVPAHARFIAYQLEQLTDPKVTFGARERALLRRAEAVWDYAPENAAFLKEQGIEQVRLLPIGYHDKMRTIRRQNADIDVLFYGSINERRKKILDQLASACVVETLFGVYAEQRDAYIARAKIVLNIHFYAAQIMEQARISYLLNNRCMVVSEESPNDPFAGAVVTVPYDRLVETCRHYLADAQERHRAATQAHQWFREHPMSEYLRAVLEPRVEERHQL